MREEVAAMSLPFFMGAQKRYLLIDNNRITTGGNIQNATRRMGYTRIETSRAGRYFLSAKLERMQEKIIGREGQTVLS